MNTIHTLSIIIGSLALVLGIILSVIKGTFQEYYQLVFIGCVLAGLGVINKNNRKKPKY